MNEFLIRLFFGKTVEDIKKNYKDFKKQYKDICKELLKERDNLLLMQRKNEERINQLVSIVGTISHNQARQEFVDIKKRKLSKEEEWTEMQHYFDLDRTIRGK